MLNPTTVSPWALLLQGKAEEAISHYQEAIQLKPDWPEPLNDLAWLFATYPRAELRNGAQAVDLAERACKLTNFKEARFLGTLDASYAEAGRFRGSHHHSRTNQKPRSRRRRQNHRRFG